MIYNALNTIKVNLIYKNKNCFIRYTKTNYLILLILLKHNFISSFSKHYHNNKILLKCTFVYHQQKPIIKQIILLKKQKTNLICSATLINKLNNRCIYIISTNKGIMSANDCILNFLGGNFYCKIIV